MTDTAAKTRSGRRGADALPMPLEMLKAHEQADVVDLPARTVLAIDGHGTPAGPGFQDALRAIYAVVYTLKFGRRGDHRFRIGPLECRWLKPPPAPWRLRIAVPDDVTDVEVEAAKRDRGADAERVRIEHIPASRVGRALHVGPYADEEPTFAAIGEAIHAAGADVGEVHVEVYLSDPRHTAPERLRTALFVDCAT